MLVFAIELWQLSVGNGNHKPESCHLHKMTTSRKNVKECNVHKNEIMKLEPYVEVTKI